MHFQFVDMIFNTSHSSWAAWYVLKIPFWIWHSHIDWKASEKIKNGILPSIHLRKMQIHIYLARAAVAYLHSDCTVFVPLLQCSPYCFCVKLNLFLSWAHACWCSPLQNSCSLLPFTHARIRRFVSPFFLSFFSYPSKCKVSVLNNGVTKANQLHFQFITMAMFDFPSWPVCAALVIATAAVVDQERGTRMGKGGRVVFLHPDAGRKWIFLFDFNSLDATPQQQRC